MLHAIQFAHCLYIDTVGTHTHQLEACCAVMIIVQGEVQDVQGLPQPLTS